MYNTQKNIQILNDQEKVKRVVEKTVSTYIKDRQEQDDVKQNVYLKMLENKDSYREIGKLIPWSTRIAINESISLLRKKNKVQLCDINEDIDTNHESSSFCIDNKKVYEEVLDGLKVKLSNNNIDDVDFKISKDFIVKGMNKTCIRKEEHVSTKRIRRVLNECRDFILQQSVIFRKKIEKKGLFFED